MSADLEKAADMMLCCASCGIAEVDDVKLKTCNDCDLVQYCSIKCQEEHLPRHERACAKRAAELRDEVLFRQPESSSLGDCPICFLPLPLDEEESTVQSCCSTMICNGCVYANMIRQRGGRLQQTCPFCRHPAPKTQKEAESNYTKRVEANNPDAIRQMGAKYYHEGDYERAVECYNKAAVLGDVVAHYNLSVMYRKGEGVEKDEKKEKYHVEEAAIAGHPTARFNLACFEVRMERIERAVKHLIIAANLGHDESIKTLRECYVHGGVSKEEFAAALRAHQATVDATKSPQREAAARAESAGEITWW